MPTYSVVLHKGKEKRDEILPAKSKNDANEKAQAKFPGWRVDTLATFKMG